VEDHRLDALFLDMLTQPIYLVIIDPNENAAVAGPIIRPSLGLIQDELEAE
jgi:hypothetical protein